MVSPINGIIEGLYEVPMTLEELSTHGDFGIGTFNDLDGELIRLDGQTFRLDVDGVAHIPAGEVCTPFATVTDFAPYSQEPIGLQQDKSALQAFLDKSLPSKNMLFAIRIDGHFQQMRTRSVPLSANHTPLVEATALEKVVNLGDVRGSLIGFYTPAFMPSINVPGYHFHFITDDRSRGGHLIDFTIVAAQMSIQLCHRMLVNLPMTLDYLGADFVRDARSDLLKAEH